MELINQYLQYPHASGHVDSQSESDKMFLGLMVSI